MLKNFYFVIFFGVLKVNDETSKHQNDMDPQQSKRLRN
jgi:hypothetical protein